MLDVGLVSPSWILKDARAVGQGLSVVPAVGDRTERGEAWEVHEDEACTPLRAIDHLATAGS